MIKTVTSEDINQAEEDGIQIVDVMGAEEFERIHIQGADNIPLTMLNRATTERLDQTNPVVVYCFDAY